MAIIERFNELRKFKWEIFDIIPTTQERKDVGRCLSKADA